MRVPFEPTAFPNEARMHLLYELHLTNFATSPLSVSGIEVLDADAKQREFRDRFTRHGGIGASDIFAVIVDTFDGEVVIAGLAPLARPWSSAYASAALFTPRGEGGGSG